MYDLADRLVQTEDSAGLTATYEYDEIGRQHKLSYTVGGETFSQEMTYDTGALADRPSGLKQDGEHSSFLNLGFLLLVLFFFLERRKER